MTGQLSPEIIAANAKLEALRRAFQQERAAVAGETAVSSSSSVVLAAAGNNNGRAQQTAVSSSFDPAPPQTAVSSTITWHLKNAEADRQRRQPRPQTAVSGPVAISVQEPVKPAKTAVSAPLPLDGITEIKVWPGLASALKKAGYAPHYRLYLAAQLLDETGNGRVYVSDIRSSFTEKKNGRYLFTWRRMRQILNDGDGILWNWNRRTNKIFLRSPQHMAKTGALDLPRVGRAVLLPAAVLFSGQGKFNAHIHAAWLAAHGDEDKPISQAAIEAATAVSERTQRHYNHVAGVQRQKNIEIGEKHTELSEEQTAWRYGHNSFEFIDYHGRQGERNGRYRARQLPNSYKRRHHRANKGRQRKINQNLAHLVKKRSGAAAADERLKKRYHANGAAAAKSFNRHPDQPTYWQSNECAGDYHVWFSL